MLEELSVTESEEKKENILRCRVLKADETSGHLDLISARISEDKVVVWFEDERESFLYQDYYYAIYDLDGNYLTGYEIWLDQRNGVFDVDLYSNRLLVFSSSVDCIYSIDGENIRCYEAKDTAKYFEKHGVTNSFDASIAEYLACGVVIRKAGKLVTIVDHSEEYLAFQSQQPWYYGWLPAFILLGGSVVFMIVDWIHLSGFERIRKRRKD